MGSDTSEGVNFFLLMVSDVSKGGNFFPLMGSDMSEWANFFKLVPLRGCKTIAENFVLTLHDCKRHDFLLQTKILCGF